MERGKTAGEGTDPLVGSVINDRFRIVRRIGRGGVGAVYLAMQAPFDRRCAVKILRPRHDADLTEDFHRRFFLEASTAAKLQHPNNVAIFDYGRTDEGMYFMAMEYLEGRTLRDALRAEGPFDEERTAHIARQICRALREAHHHKVIHRDIKPSNVFLLDRHDERDVVKVLDFGLVKEVKEEDSENLTQAGFFMGSPKYVAPEQIESGPVDARTDIYSVGVVMYEMLTGRVPFDRGATVKTLIAHIKEDPPPLWDANPRCEVTPLLEQTVMRCLAKDPDQRIPSMAALLEVLKRSPAGTLTGTLTDESGRVWVDSGPLGLSGSLPQPTTVTAPHGATSGAVPAVDGNGRGSRDGVRPSWRRHGTLLVAGAAILGAVGVPVLLLGQRVEDRDTAGVTDAAGVSVSAASSPDPEAITSASIPASASAHSPAPLVPLRLVVVPANASVRTAEGKKLCEESPCRIGARHFQQGALTVTVGAPGYRSQKLKLALQDEETTVRLRALPVRVVPRETASPPPPTPPSTPPGTGFGEFPPY